MISVYTDEFRQSYLNYLGLNLVAILINAPALGITNSPTPQEYLNRIQLTTVQAAALEVPLNANGYKRSIVLLGELETSVDGQEYSAEATSTFNAVVGAIGPFTHICYLRGANLIGANDANGNNRGNIVGTLVQVEPILNAPLTLQPNFTFIHTTRFVISTRGLNE